MTPEIAAGDGFQEPERDALAVRWHSLAFSIERSKCYYELRKQWFQRWALIVPGFSLIAGSMAVTTTLDSVGAWARPAAIASATVLAIFAVLLRFPHRAQEYQGLLDKTLALEARMVKGPQTRDILVQLEQDRQAIAYGPERAVLNVICHNKVVQSWGYGKDYIRPVGFWQNLLKQFLTEYRDPSLHKKLPPPTKMEPHGA